MRRVTHTRILPSPHSRAHAHAHTCCTPPLQKQTLTTVAATQPPCALRHSPCHIAEDVGADHHASPAPHLFPLLLQPLLQGLLQEHLRDEQRHGRRGVAEIERNREGGGEEKKNRIVYFLFLVRLQKRTRRDVTGPCCLLAATPCPPQRRLWCS